MIEPKIPMLEKMKKVHETSQKIGFFLDWLSGQGVQLAVYHEHSGGCYRPHDHDLDLCNNHLGGLCTRQSRVTTCESEDGQLITLNRSIEQLLADYYKIDLEQVHEEQQAVLGYTRRTGGQDE